MISDMNPFEDQINRLTQEIESASILLEDPELAPLAKSEIQDLESQIEILRQAMNQLSSQQTESTSQSIDQANCTMEFRPGTGGDEAKIWANDLMRMYVRFIETTKLRVSFIDEMVIKISGKYILDIFENIDNNILFPYQLFQSESGVHRVQRVPITESQGRIHTSTATVAVLPEVPSNVITVRDEDLEWQFIRASGAGGQHVNKTSSAVRLTHLPSGIMVTSQQEKRQEQNRKIALDLLRAQLWEIEEEKRLAQLGEARSAIGRARRAEKIRTYNFPQNRITDHRTKQSWYNLEEILDGQIGTMLSELLPELNKADYPKAN